MTCIIGLQENGKAWVGGDSAAVDGWRVTETGLQKVFRVGQYVIGYTDSFRMGQLLQYQVEYPYCPEPTEGFMVKEFIEPIRKALKDFGYSKIESNQETAGNFIVGVKGRIFEIEEDLQINYSADGIRATGSGFAFALGAMRAFDLLDPVNRITRSLEISAYFNGRVKPPYIVMEVPGE